MTWEDPALSATRRRQMSGMEFMRAMARGDVPVPPMARLLGFEAAHVEDGRVVFAGDTGEYLFNPQGTVHGGFAATLLDSAMGCAVHTTLAAGEPYTTLEIKVSYVRPVAAGVRVRAEGHVVHRGRRIATAEGRLVAERDGRLLAHGTTTCMILASAER